jgi:hypothetical protein
MGILCTPWACSSSVQCSRGTVKDRFSKGKYSLQGTPPPSEIMRVSRRFLKAALSVDPRWSVEPAVNRSAWQSVTNRCQSFGLIPTVLAFCNRKCFVVLEPKAVTVARYRYSPWCGIYLPPVRLQQFTACDSAKRRSFRRRPGT